MKKLLSTRTVDQRTRLLARLKERGSVSTIEARKELDILAPAPRILELRRDGHNIPLFWQIEETQPGQKHRVGLYVYLPKIGDIND